MEDYRQVGRFGCGQFAYQNLGAVKSKMHTALIFDGRNLFDPATMKELGFIYYAVGRPVIE